MTVAPGLPSSELMVASMQSTEPCGACRGAGNSGAGPTTKISGTETLYGCVSVVEGHVTSPLLSLPPVPLLQLLLDLTWGEQASLTLLI